MPISWRLIGNRDLAAEYRGEANRLFFHLRSVLGETPSGGINRVYPDGTRIFLRKFFDSEIALISSPYPTGGGEKIVKLVLVFLYTGPEDKTFYLLDFPDSLDETEEPPDFDNTDEDSNADLGALGYVIRKEEGNSHIITIGTPYENWDLVQDNLTPEAFGMFPITAFWNVPAGCVHAHIRGGSEEDKWGTCGYPEDAIIPPEHSMAWPFRSVLSFSYVAKKRTMNPIYGCWIPIKNDDVIVWQKDPQYIDQNWGVSGKRNFKLNADKDEALSWRDTLQVSGLGTMNSSGYFTPTGGPPGGLLAITYGWYPYPNPGFCWKPWYAWLHEIPTFDYFDADSYLSAKQNIADEWNLQPRPAYKYRRKFKTASGEVIKNDLFTEIFNHHYNLASSESSSDFEWDHRCPGASYSYGNYFDYEKSKTEYGGSTSGTVYTPIASLGDGKYLYVSNVFGGRMSHEGGPTTGTKHEDNYPCDWDYCNQSGQLDCSCNDGKFGLPFGTWSHHDMSFDSLVGTWGLYNTQNNIGLTQKLLFDASTIEECSSALTYGLDIITFAGTHSWTLSHGDPRWWVEGQIWVCDYTVDEQGSRTENNREDVEHWTRNQQFIEVLDYDNVGTDTIIVIYKKVEIAHSANFSYKGYGVNVAAADFPYPDEPTKLFNWEGTRTVTYWVWIKMGQYVAKFQIPHTFVASCVGKKGILENEEVKEELQTGSGQRIYGVSCQINDDFIVYSYAVEDFAVTPFQAANTSYDYYSSPLNWEDRNKQGIKMNGFPVWKKKKMVLGAVDVETHERAAFDVEEFTDQKVYSVGMHNSESLEVRV